MPTLRRTTLYQHHVDLAAQWTSFAGWEVPLQYQRVVLEHQAVRNAAGLFDISHMGIFHLPEGVLAKLDATLPLLISEVEPNKAQYSLILNHQGTVVDDVMLYRLPATETFMTTTPAGGAVLVANAANTNAVQTWLFQVLGYTPEPLGLDLLALQGPAFQQVLDNTNALPNRYRLGKMTLVEGLPPVWVARTGYTGEDGLEMFCLNGSLYWSALIKRLLAIGGLPCGFAARDSLRLEAALPLYGHELDMHTTPAEAGLSWAIRKPTGFLGDAYLAKPLTKQLVHLKLDKPPIPRQGNSILNASGQNVGIITSGGLSATLGHPIAMGYLFYSKTNTMPYQLGDAVTIDIRGKQVQATLVARPFYKRTV
jgi:aminomethyltransferase